MPNNELQELLGARFEAHTHPTNEAVWNAIEAQLDADQSNRAGIWFWVFNGIAAVVLFGLMFQSQKRGIISTESNGIELSEMTQTEKSSLEDKESFDPKSVTQSAIVDLDKNSFNARSSTLAQEAILENSSNSSSRTSKTTRIQQKTEQIVLLPEVSTHFDGGFVVSTSTRPKYSNYAIDGLSTKPLSFTEKPATIQKMNPLGLNYTSDRYFDRLPMYLGCEFSILNRERVEFDALTGLDSSYAGSNDGLAYSRHFEISLFSQFDISQRLSASIGFGYSRSTYSPADGPISSFSSSNTQKKSELHLFSLPIQTKISVLQINRFDLSAGLTFQGEFGNVTHVKADPIESWSTTASPAQSESVVINKFNLRQFAFEPYVQFSVNITPRISSFANLGYRMYLHQADKNVAPIGRLNYFNADVGLMFRLH